MLRAGGVRVCVWPRLGISSLHVPLGPPWMAGGVMHFRSGATKVHTSGFKLYTFSVMRNFPCTFLHYRLYSTMHKRSRSWMATNEG